MFRLSGSSYSSERLRLSHDTEFFISVVFSFSFHEFRGRSSIFIFYLSLLPKSILSQRLGADSSFSKEPAACGRDEGTAKRRAAKTHFATRPCISKESSVMLPAIG
jgi:hypothetical protein